MAISNSTDFSITRDEIITQAYRQIGVLAEGETASLEQVEETAPVLNMMLKTWQSDGLNLFAIQKVYLFLDKDKSSYTLGSSTTDHYTSSFYETTLAVAASSTDTTITVASDDNISDGDYIGIAQGTDVQWTTVNGTPASDVVTLTTALTASAAVGAKVYTYTSKSSRPMDLVEVYTHLTTSNSDLVAERIPRREYNNLSNKNSTGVITQVYYDPQLSASTLNVWPRANDERDYLVLITQKTLSDLDSSLNNPEYPQEWFLPIYLNLALLLSTRYGVPNDVYQKIAQQAMYWYEKAQGFDNELYTSVYFTHDNRQ